MVPRSHSRAIVSAVSMAAMIIMITATSPGTIMFALSSASLYHTRLSTVTGTGSAARLSTTFDEKAVTMASA